MTQAAIPEPEYPWVSPLKARIKVNPEDFVVDEVPATLPEGAGTHLWLQVRKAGENTETVAEWLARTAGVARAAVGYAGRKDRHALTTQWFSVDLAGTHEPTWDDDLPAGVRILAREWHPRKLKTGHLAGNRFRLTLREVQGDRVAADLLLARIRDHGLPAYFGEQRFGHANVERARAWFAGRIRPRSRNQRGLYLSAARAAIFNTVLARRVRDGTWDRLLAGDLANLDGRGSVFPVPLLDDELEARCARLEIHPTGPLWGRGQPNLEGRPRVLEDEVAAVLHDLARGLEREGVSHARRALRMRPKALNWNWPQADTLVLDMELGPGEYATGVAAAIAEIADASRASET